MRSRFNEGDLNDNRQRLLEKTNRLGSVTNQYVWRLRCERGSPATGQVCGQEYDINGSAFRNRRCPLCQAGKTGVQVSDQRRPAKV